MKPLSFDLSRSKTVWGTVIAVLGYLSQPEVFALLPDQVAEVVKVVGVILAAIGLRDAATQPDAPPPAAEEGP